MPNGTRTDALADDGAAGVAPEVAGTVKYGEIIDGVTMQETLDEITGLSRRLFYLIELVGRRPPSVKTREVALLLEGRHTGQAPEIDAVDAGYRKHDRHDQASKFCALPDAVVSEHLV